MEHYLQYIMDMTAEQGVIVKDSGDIELEGYQNIIDVSDTHLHCTACARNGLDLYEFHKVSREYDVF